MKRTRFILAACGAAVVIGSTALVPAVSAVAKSGPTPSATAKGTSGALAQQSPAFWKKQQKLQAYKGWLLKVKGISAAGYVESVDDVNALSTQLLWHGSSSLQAKAVAQGKARGIAVTIKPWAYSQKQIDAGIAKLWKDTRTNAAYRGFTVADIVGVQLGAKGLTLEGDWTDSSASSLSASQRTARAAGVTARASKATGMSVAIATKRLAAPAFTRSNDTTPFYAAGYMLSPSLSRVCSTGFSIRVGGVARATTARHCTANDYRARDGSAVYGTTITTSGPGLARVLSGSGGARNFDGAWNDPNGFNKHVAGLVNVGLNNYVCTSGGNSGVHCNIKITATNVSWNDGFGAASTIQGTQQSAGQISAIQGDSGGTVFTLTGSDVLAAGMIQAINGTLMTGASCGSVHDGGSNLCSANVLFTSTSAFLNSIAGATLVT